MSTYVPYNTVAKRADEIHVGDVVRMGDSRERVWKVTRESDRLVRIHTGTRVNGRFIEWDKDDVLNVEVAPT